MGQRVQVGPLSVMIAQEGQKIGEVSAIGVQRMGRTPSFGSQPLLPRLNHLDQIGLGGKDDGLQAHDLRFEKPAEAGPDYMGQETQEFGALSGMKGASMA